MMVKDCEPRCLLILSREGSLSCHTCYGNTASSEHPPPPLFRRLLTQDRDTVDLFNPDSHESACLDNEWEIM